MPLPAHHDACLLLQDDLVGTAVLDLGQLGPSALPYLELPLSFEKSKHAAAGGQARLVLSVKGWVNSFGTLLADTKHIPGGLQISFLVGGVHLRHGGLIQNSCTYSQHTMCVQGLRDAAGKHAQ